MKKGWIMAVAALLLLAAIPFAGTTALADATKIDGFDVKGDDLKDGVLKLKESAAVDDLYLLTVDSTQDWKAELESDKFVQFSEEMLVGSRLVPATVNNTKEASGLANESTYLTIRVESVPKAGKTSTEKLTFTVGEETTTYEIRLTAPAPKFELKCSALDGSTISFHSSA